MASKASGSGPSASGRCTRSSTRGGCSCTRSSTRDSGGTGSSIGDSGSSTILLSLGSTIPKSKAKRRSTKHSKHSGKAKLKRRSSNSTKKRASTSRKSQTASRSAGNRSRLKPSGSKPRNPQRNPPRKNVRRRSSGSAFDGQHCTRKGGCGGPSTARPNPSRSGSGNDEVEQVSSTEENQQVDHSDQVEGHMN